MAESKEIQKVEAEDPRWVNYEPTPEDQMTFVGHRVTVCELLREIYNKTDSPEIKMKCRIASTLAKSMAARVTKYEGRNWGKAQYAWNPKRRHQRTKAKWEETEE